MSLGYGQMSGNQGLGPITGLKFFRKETYDIVGCIPCYELTLRQLTFYSAQMSMKDLYMSV